MPTRLSILHTINSDTAALSVAPAETAGYLIANTTTSLRQETLRTTGKTAQQLRASWTSVQSINAVAIARHNLTGTATWRIRLWPNDNFTGTVIYDSGVVNAWDATGTTSLLAPNDADMIEFKNTVHWMPALYANVRSVTIDLDDSANAASYLEICRLMIGRYDELNWNYDWGHPLTAVSQNRTVRTAGGSVLSHYVGPPQRTLALPLNQFEAADRHLLFDLVWEKDVLYDMFVSARPLETGKFMRDYQLWCKLASWQGIERPLPGYYGTQIVVAGC